MMRVVLCSSLLIAGCTGGNVYKVTSAAEGLPFYPLVPATKTTTVHEQRWQRVKVTVATAADKKPSSYEFFVYEGTGSNCTAAKTLDPLANAVANGGTPANLGAVVAAIKSCIAPPAAKADACNPAAAASPPAASVTAGQPAAGSQPVPDVTLVRKETVYEMVTAPTPMYVNVFTPYGGESTANFKFNAKGGLDSAESGVKDTYPAAVTEAMTGLAGTLIESAFSLGAGFVAKNNDKDPPVFTLELTPQRRIYTRTQSSIPTELSKGAPAVSHESCSVEIETPPAKPEPPKAEAAKPEPPKPPSK